MAPDDQPAILVVDDERGYREGIRRILRNRGLEADVAASGAEALELAARHRYALALVDLKMPELDGFAVIEKLRSIQPETLPVVVSAFATIESAVQTTKMGAFDFVVKPFVPDDLMVVVGRALETWRLAQEAGRLRKEREAHLLELAAEKSRLRTIIQSMGDGLLVVNIDGDVVLDNPVARRLLGRIHQTDETQPIAAWLPNDRFLSEIRRLLEGATQAKAVVLEVPLQAGAEGNEQFLRATLAPIRAENAEVRGVVVLLADITDAKAFERMKDLFVSMVAHELKAPIGAVEGYLHLIASGALDAVEGKTKQVATRCLERTGALLELIQDLGDITRRDVKGYERCIESVDLAALTASLVEFHQNEARKRELTMTLDAPATGACVLVDRAEMERLITNLLSNAIKYNRPGGQVRVRLRSERAVVTIEVQDTGIGMSQEEMKRLGQEFYRVKNDKTRTIPGTGLGVALVKRIVASYNGALAVDSIPGQGTTFRVVLPAARDGGDPSQAMEQ